MYNFYILLTNYSQTSLFTFNGRFGDPQGRQVILHGANLANKDPGTGYLGATQAYYAAMRRWGFNTVRLAGPLYSPRSARRVRARTGRGRKRLAKRGAAGRGRTTNFVR